MLVAGLMEESMRIEIEVTARMQNGLSTSSNARAEIEKTRLKED